MRSAPDLPPDEPRPLQHAHVLGGRRKRHPERLGQDADIFLAIGKTAEHGAAGGVGQRPKDTVEPLRSLNHVVEDIRPGAMVNQLVEQLARAQGGVPNRITCLF